MPDPEQREWRLYIDDMISFGGKVISYTSDIDQAGFVASGLNYDATLRNLDPCIRSRARVAEVLNRVRPLTLEMIRRLSEGLAIPVNVLVRRYELTEAA